MQYHDITILISFLCAECQEWKGSSAPLHSWKHIFEYIHTYLCMLPKHAHIVAHLYVPMHKKDKNQNAGTNTAKQPSLVAIVRCV